MLKDPNELALIRKMVQLPELVESMARTLEPHHLPHYALELATAFHWFYENCRVLSSDPADYPLTLARLKLVEAAQVVLSAPWTSWAWRLPRRCRWPLSRPTEEALKLLEVLKGGPGWRIGRSSRICRCPRASPPAPP